MSAFLTHMAVDLPYWLQQKLTNRLITHTYIGLVCVQLNITLAGRQADRQYPAAPLGGVDHNDPNV